MGTPRQQIPATVGRRNHDGAHMLRQRQPHVSQGGSVKVVSPIERQSVSERRPQRGLDLDQRLAELRGRVSGTGQCPRGQILVPGGDVETVNEYQMGDAIGLGDCRIEAVHASTEEATHPSAVGQCIGRFSRYRYPMKPSGIPVEKHFLRLGSASKCRRIHRAVESDTPLLSHSRYQHRRKPRSRRMVQLVIRRGGHHSLFAERRHYPGRNSMSLGVLDMHGHLAGHRMKCDTCAGDVTPHRQLTEPAGR